MSLNDATRAYLHAKCVGIGVSKCGVDNKGECLCVRNRQVGRASLYMCTKSA